MEQPPLGSVVSPVLRGGREKGEQSLSKKVG